METTAAFMSGQPDLGLNLSEAHLFYTHGGAAHVTCDTGWMPSPALDYCRDVGVTFEPYFPYTPGNSGGATLDADWPNHLAKVTRAHRPDQRRAAHQGVDLRRAAPSPRASWSSRTSSP